MTRILALAVGTGLAIAGTAATAPLSPPARAQTQPEASAPARGGTELSPSERRRPQERQPGLMRAFDLDRDGTLNLAETKSAAAKRYDDLNPDLDDALDRQEAGRHSLASATFRAADADRNGTVSKAEWLALVERRFEAADPDRDGSLSRTELRSDKGKAVARFLR
jgi:Ca2+-binding EF-hand superfamily protein